MILNINKPEGITSADVVRIIKKELKPKKIGHTGTLDPLAKGVLIIVTDEDTKLVDLLTSSFKEYIATIKFGVQTDTLDITGKVLKEEAVKVFTEEAIKEVLNSFIGKYEQIVPIYSAVKVNGKKLYEYARNNESVILPKKEVEVTEIELLEVMQDEVKFKVSVSKGTYIRSLIDDICNKLDTVGTMKDLIRTKQSIFNIENSNTIEDIKNNKFKEISKKEVLSNIPFEEVTGEKFSKIKNGALIPKDFTSKLIVYTNNGIEVAIYQEYLKDETLAKPYIMFNIDK